MFRDRALLYLDILTWVLLLLALILGHVSSATAKPDQLRQSLPHGLVTASGEVRWWPAAKTEPWKN